MNRPRTLLRDGRAALLFLAPSALGFGLFYAIPFVMGVWYSFTGRTGNGTFAGLENYKEVLSSGSFRQAAENTLLFTGIGVPLLIAVSLLLALLLNRSLYLRQTLRTVYALPLVVPVASVALVWQIFFDWNGTLNAWRHAFHLDRIDWLQSDGSLWVLLLMYLWKNIGYDVILFLAALQAIPATYYETARIEGAGRVRQLVHVTLVYVTPAMAFVVLISIVNSFKVFREAYLLEGDYPYGRIYMLQHYMNNLFLSLDVQKLSAAAVLMVGCIVLLASVLLRAERKFRDNLE